ncbi:unnamed protein product [Rotaria socialis]|uniref:Aminotransferase class V domain-containing protein n=2 Tax=Rotaria socialis TaxID=392032 RepID=A0A820HCX9_9BILA|nr:unnamed protein product [Rotaria socialis]CAF4291544.1 unnamed protein product [Rotaria socialis]
MERYAINSYFSSVHIPEPSESVNVDAKRSTKGSLESKTLNETEEDSRKHSTLNEPLINCQSQLTASPPSQKLYNSMHQASTINPSERISFSEHCSHIVSNVDGTSSLFSKIYELDHTVYADYTASGRGLIFIEHYMLTYVWPFYANTHSENNAFALQTTRFRESARSIIKKCLNVTDDDVVIFTGSGSTAAINKFVDILQLRTDEIRNRTVVFVSTSEHHSNILPWKETGVQFVRIPNNEKGLLDQNVLKENLIYYRDLTKKSIICIFNAGSNVTGVLADVDRISELVHEHGGYIFWDYAAAAPYVHIDMNPSEKAAKDAVFISTHKFIGGPGTPGLLIAKKKLFENPVPTGCGGGTVNFVTRTATEYAKDIETREEGGTPSILGSIRAGLVFHLKQSIGHELIEGRETELVHKFFQRFQNHPTLFILGPPDVSRLAIFSFLIYVPSVDKYLHHNFICSLLNDLFGIQVRSGGSCAEPYVLDLLNIDDEQINMYSKFYTEDLDQRFDKDNDPIPYNALMKPGFTRFNLPYFASDDEVNYILGAIEFVASFAWRFLPLYQYNQETAVWRPRHLPVENRSNASHSLAAVDYQNGTMEQINFLNNKPQNIDHQIPLANLSSSSSDDPFEQAKAISKNMPQYVYENIDFRTDTQLNIPKKYEHFIWFVTPKEIMIKLMVEFECLQQKDRLAVPFQHRYRSIQIV